MKESQIQALRAQVADASAWHTYPEMRDEAQVLAAPGVRMVLSRYGEESTYLCGRYCWQITIGEVSACGVAPTREAAVARLQAALPVIAMADQALQERL